MATTITTDWSGTATYLEVQDDEHYILAAGVRLVTIDYAAIQFNGARSQFDIEGQIVGASGIRGVWGMVTDDSTVNVGASGVVMGFDHYGIYLSADGQSITNDGLIWGGDAGISLQQVAAFSGDPSLITNRGTITSLYAGVLLEGDTGSTFEIHNTGVIEGGSYSITSVSYGVDRIINSGVLKGDVRLYDDNDYYDGRLGTIVGVVEGGSGDDELLGGAGDEIFDGENGNDILSGGGGNDTLEGGFGDDVLNGGSGNDTLDGGTGADVLDGGTGADFMDGREGDDIFYVDDAGDVVNERVADGTDTVNASISYNLTANVENLVLTGSANLNGTGNDLANSLTGNAGNNVLNGGTGADRMEGGQGNDTYYVDNAGDVVVESSNGGIDTVRAARSYTLGSNVENLVLTGTGNLSGTGNSLANSITGNSGNNTLNGSSGNDTLSGGSGNDRLLGGSGNDVLNGGSGNDRMEGSSGNDRLTGNSGADILFGGSGADRFIFKALSDSTVSSSGRDVIEDFSRSQGDRIDLSAIDASTKSSGNQAFSFIGEKAFTGKAGELRYVNSGGDTFIYGDVNGDKTSDFSIRIDANIDLVKGDFIL
ncbi:calcium-binding protein [Ciceribacter sp. L1K22]|uniref:calcium-binding protein n=1 Tax=Ciceribacter sp. L1K22 TaxID=2820275 RepID=UPI001ABDDCB9|nr:calcium-binding protein [Ciceribacter sp. L1K22]MBO3762535.1 calcium-binding protein [Ciceribacter sp. L1K22]